MRRQLVHAEIELKRFQSCSEDKRVNLICKKHAEIAKLEAYVQELAILNGAVRTAPRSDLVAAWCFTRRDFESYIKSYREQISYYNKMIDKICARDLELSERVQDCNKQLQELSEHSIRAPLTPMIGTNQAIRRMLYNRSAAGQWSRYRPSNNIGEWMAFAVITMNIPLLLMETNAIEAHVVLAFKAPQSRQLPDDVLAIVSGYAVAACRQTRVAFRRNPVDASPEEMKQRHVANQYVRPWDECGRRMYVAGWKASC